MADITTSLSAAFKRATSSIIDDIAVEGLQALRQVLDAKFKNSEFLKDYKVYVHVNNSELEYEIVLSGDAVEEKDKAEEESDDQVEQEAQKDTLIKAYRKYGLTKDNKPIRYSQMRDVKHEAKDSRKPARDARTPARNARKTSNDRMVEHEISLHAPRSMNVNSVGKLNLKFKRSTRQTSQGMKYPEGEHEGLMEKFMDELQQIILSNFAPAIQTIMSRYV